MAVHYARPRRGLDPLSYSDGNQYSLYDRDGDGRRPGARRAATRTPSRPTSSAGPSAAGYGNVDRPAARRYDAAATSTTTATASPSPERRRRRARLLPLRGSSYYDFDSRRQAVRRRARRGRRRPHELRRDARPHDCPATGRLLHGEAPYPVAYAGTNLVDADTDGDGVRDGADDQDHDDIPNIMELSRNAASGHLIVKSCSDKDGDQDTLPTPAG